MDAADVPRARGRSSRVSEQHRPSAAVVVVVTDLVHEFGSTGIATRAKAESAALDFVTAAPTEHEQGDDYSCCRSETNDEGSARRGPNAAVTRRCHHRDGRSRRQLHAFAVKEKERRMCEQKENMLKSRLTYTHKHLQKLFKAKYFKES